ncbi:hypothetical protein L1987_29095 [Smallanthus sonchifolius]|uniref:Uncharacterized protein n=1 Tax=Smallanthus sonchifolius TaxID=185202 RepID=A0ACB9I0H5_9ASTR|nr:hypothetical protein L1987_29095 [Smallanthus sonchifolius]
MDVNLLKQELEDDQQKSEISVTEDYFRPVIQEMIQRKDCECYVCNNILNGVKGIVVATRVSYGSIRRRHIHGKLLEESKGQEQEVMDNLKLEKFLIDRGHVVNKSREEISYTYKDVNLLKEGLQDYKDENGISVDEDYSIPVIQETIPRQDCECYKCHVILKGVVKERVVSRGDENKQDCQVSDK